MADRVNTIRDWFRAAFKAQVGWAEPNDTGVGTNRWLFYEATGAPEVMVPVYIVREAEG